jgi:sulfate permease, SulP family
VIDEMNRQGVSLILTGLPPRTIVKLRRAGIRKTMAKLTYTRSLKQARATALRWCDAAVRHPPA